jgi:hypothetical protein
MQNLNSLTLFVRELSRIRTDGHGNLISPKAGLKMINDDQCSKKSTKVLKTFTQVLKTFTQVLKTFTEVLKKFTKRSKNVHKIWHNLVF